MNVKQYIKFEFNNDDYYSINKGFQSNISYIVLFFHNAYRYAQRDGIEKFINDLYTPDAYGDREKMFEMITVSVDNEADLVYIHEDCLDFIETIKSKELIDFYEELSDLDLCRNNIIGRAVMIKDNFIYLLTTWDQLWDQKPPFILLYQNDKDWYELLPCQSEEEMDKFVTDHS